MLEYAIHSDSLAGNRVIPERCFPEHSFLAKTTLSGVTVGGNTMIKIGEKYSMLTVIAEAGRNRTGHKQFLVQCDCGTRKILPSTSVERAMAKSCGCYHDEFIKTHGMSKTNEYEIWSAMKRRCNNPNVTGYESYGGRGISVCQKWSDSFEAFFEDMGHRPSDNHSIERIDNDGDYEPSNCKWATRDEQARNRRNNVNIENKTQTDWARDFGLCDSAVKMRIRRGMSPEDAVKIKGPMKDTRVFEVTDKITGEVIGHWNTKVECAKDLGISDNHIGTVLNGKRPSTHGYKMEYIQEEAR